MARSRRKKNGRQKALDGWSTHPTGREESALVDFVQETDFEEHLHQYEVEDRLYFGQDLYWYTEAPVGGVYGDPSSWLDIDYLSDWSDLGEERFILPAELRPTADDLDLQHLERLETGSYQYGKEHLYHGDMTYSVK